MASPNLILCDHLMPNKPQFTIMEVAHVGITVTSLQDALHFWVDVLGFRLVSVERDRSGEILDNIVGVKGARVSFAVVEAPGHRIELIEYHSPSDRKIMKPRSCDVGSFHLCLSVDDLDAVLSRVEQSGWLRLSFSKSFLKRAWNRAQASWQQLTCPQNNKTGQKTGTRLMYVRGPDGTTIEFQESTDSN